MLEWSEFARRLGRELAGLERDTILIVRERDESRHYVQAMREPDRLYAEAVSNNFLEGPLLLTLADEEVMSEAGWRPPADPAPRNWWTELPEAGMPGGMLSVTDADFSRLADVMVTALRDVQGVRRPSDLVYESFHRHGSGLIELLDFGIEVADPSRVSKSRASSGGFRPGAEPLPGADPLPVAPLAADAPPPGTPLPLPEQALPGMDAELLEPRLAEAKANGDNTAYFKLLENADLVLPATASAVEDPDRAEFPTITIGSGTYVTVFTSPGALARTGDRHPGLYRRTSFARLAAGWPDPAWRLAINWGLPSEVLLDSSVIGRLQGGRGGVPDPLQYDPLPNESNPYGTVDPNALSGPNPVAGSAPPVNGSAHGIPAPGGAAPGGMPPGEAAGVPYDDSHTAVDPFTAADLRAALDAGGPPPRAPEPAAAAPLGAPTDDPPADTPPPANPPAGTRPAGTGPAAEPPDRPARHAPAPGPRPAGVPIRPPHGTRLWRSAGEGEQVPVAVYDAIGGAWTPVRADAVPSPWTE
ncbi:SseB family protein [Actinomadura mexicana]|uniref:SseB protein N-terminal domain-containing protein n=1 Tax=Actinomadura mexicana TaxID=134959 RepID=A0A239FYW3_9ACTN|nr:SseB family protein [Actinomadura mexicana]SNS62069.1 SseB protein N-terminal domain-containing protein [Actinomadura mexicana]